MSFLDKLLGTDDSTLAAKDIAQDMLKDSKFAVTSLSAAAAEAVNPELREMLRGQLDKAVAEHFELSDIAVDKVGIQLKRRLWNNLEMNMKTLKI